MIPKTRCKSLLPISLMAAALISAAQIGSAQDAEPAPEAEPAQEAAPAPEASQPQLRQPGSPYFREDVGDWRIRCVPAPVADQDDVCQLYQLLLDPNQNPVAEFTILPDPEGTSDTVLATIVTPLETLLPPGLRMSIDGSPEQAIPYTWCSNIGCYARFRLGPPDVETLKAGSEATIGITPLAAPDQQVRLTSSLIGFTRALEAVSAK